MCTLDISKMNFELDAAIEYGDRACAKKILSTRPDSYVVASNSIVYASSRGYFEIVQMMLDLGTNIHVANEGAICMAYACRKFETVKFLLFYYKPQKHDSSFTAMIYINNFKLIQRYNKHMSCIIDYKFYGRLPSVTRQISKYIIRNTAINNKQLVDAIYSENYHIHKTKVLKPTNRQRKQYKN